MASDKEFVLFVADQFENCGEITSRAMFGEYGIYADGKLFGLICDNKLFIKPTKAGRAYIENLVEAPPYPGAKNSFLIGDKIEDRSWLSELARITLEELPEPRKKKKQNNLKNR